MPAALTSAEACDRLGIRPQTLYAYVSRGLLQPRKVGRRSLFPAAQVETLAQRTARGRRPGRFEINIETAITLLDPAGRLLYRGVDVADIATRWSYERVAHWLWTGGDDGEPSVPWPVDAGALERARRVQADLDERTPLGDRLRVSVAVIAAHRRPLPNDEQRDGRVLVATLVESLPTIGRARRAPGDASIAGRLWPRLTASSSSLERLRALDTALVLLADHELAASTLAARVAASTRAGVHEVVLAGLAALSGPLHGGHHDVVAAMLRDADALGARRAVDAACERHRFLPGTGHAVYRERDPRASLLLGALRASAPAARMKVIDDAVGALRARTDAPVNADLALGALSHVHRMTAGAGEAIFAVARIAGWLAHAVEESAYHLRFRPRAVYTGVR